MTLSKLPSGRWRARIWHDGKDVPVGQILGTGARSYRTRGEAKDAYGEARRLLRTGKRAEEITVLDWWERWTTQPAYARPKQSTNVHNREASKLFVDRYGHLALGAVDRRIVGEWRESGQRDWTIPALRAMWFDAIDKAGLIESNPFARLRIKTTRGNRDVVPPSQEMVWRLIRRARDFGPPGFAAWLQVAAFTGMRPGELDALRWGCVDFAGARLHVVEQFSVVSRTFTLPKNGQRRYAPLTDQAREALQGLPRESEFCFTNTQRKHWNTTSRAYWWDHVKKAVGYEDSLYLATRHHAGWYMYNVLDFPAEDVAIALGHEDGGQLVRTLYGHRDKDRALDRIVAGYASRSNVVPLSALRVAEEA